MSNEQDLNALFGTLSANGLHVSSMRTKSNRLEELFMGLVERKTKERSA